MSEFMDVTGKFTGKLSVPGQAMAEVRDALRQQLTGAGLYLEGELARATPAYTGAAQRGWFTEYDDDNQTARVANPLEYIVPLELGRRAAFVPVKPLELWVRRKLGVDDKNARRIAFAISRKKARFPTPGLRFAQTAFEQALPTIQSAFIGPLGPIIVERLSR